MTLRSTEKTYCLVYWPDSHLYMSNRARAYYAPDAPLDERGGDIYFVETSFIKEVQGPQRFRRSDLYSVVDLSSKPNFVYMTTLELHPIYSDHEFSTDCFFVPTWLVNALECEFSAYKPEPLNYTLRPFL